MRPRARVVVDALTAVFRFFLCGRVGEVVEWMTSVGSKYFSSASREVGYLLWNCVRQIRQKLFCAAEDSSWDYSVGEATTIVRTTNIGVSPVNSFANIGVSKHICFMSFACGSRCIVLYCSAGAEVTDGWQHDKRWFKIHAVMSN